MGTALVLLPFYWGTDRSGSLPKVLNPGRLALEYLLLDLFFNY